MVDISIERWLPWHGREPLSLMERLGPALMQTAPSLRLTLTVIPSAVAYTGPRRVMVTVGAIDDGVSDEML